ncbi:MAG: carboxypeptidase regulatory-like domain-containing protein [Archangiaceae bacterium]|nr:carboxypeptidase regulatory-like domain-containing protein [Archangiaceae bacterium]
MTGLAVVATPGKTTLQPVEGALVEIAGAGRTRTNAEGFFELSGLDGTRSTLRLAYDLDGDGTPDRQKTIDLTAFGFKRGRDVALGQVVLGRNAAVTGHLLRGDRAMAKSGHSGTVVFVPEAPFSALTADDGSFTLGELPEGPLTLSSFRAGFDPIGQLLTLRAGEELRLADEVLPLATRVPGAATLAGTVHAGTRPAQSAQVTLFSSGQPRASAATSAEGAYRFEAVAAGLYDLTVVLDGFESVLLRNVFVTEGDNAVTDVTLQAGTSVVPDAGALLPPVDAGLFPDGGVDPGPPEAFITPAVLPFAYDVDTPLDQIATFSGGASAGVQPCSFQWSVLDGGASLDPPNGPYAASVTLRMQGFGEPNRTVLQLVATDPFGRASPPVTAALQAAVVPIAVVTGPMAFTQGRLVLSGATSSDPWNLQLVEYRWVASPSTAVQLNPVGRTDVEVVARTPGSTTVSLVVRNAFGLESPPFPYVLRVLPGDVDAGVPPGDGGVPPGDGGQKGTAFLASGSLTPDGPLRLWLSQPADPATFTQVKLTAPDGGLITVDSVGARSDLLPDAGVLLTLPFGTRLTANERYQVQLLGLATAGGQTYSFTPPAVPPSVHELARSPMVRASADVNTTGAAVTPGIGVTWAVGEERLLVAAACAADKKVQTYNFFAAGTDGTALPPQNTYSTTVATLQTGRRMHTARIGPEDRLFFHAFAAQGRSPPPPTAPPTSTCPPTAGRC